LGHNRWKKKKYDIFITIETKPTTRYLNILTSPALNKLKTQIIGGFVMRKGCKIIFCIMGLIIVMSPLGFAGHQIWVPLDGSTDETGASATVISSNERETVIKININGFGLTESGDADDGYTILDIPGWPTTREIGKPQLPVFKKLVAIPGNTDVNANIVGHTEVVMSGYKIFPFQKPLLETQIRSALEIDRLAYSENAYYPEKMTDLGEISIWRDLRVVPLAVYPFKYNPVTGDLVIYTEITVRIEYRGFKAKNSLTYGIRPISPEYDNMYRSAVINYDYLNLTKAGDLITAKTATAQWDYLIIAADRYYDSQDPNDPIQDFADYKNGRGLSTRIKLLSDICDPPDTAVIRDTIAQAYTTDGIKYVLLVGDVDELPSFSGYRYNDDGTESVTAKATIDRALLSDYYYACVAGSDNLAEVAVGRFSVDYYNYETELVNMVGKCKTYESNYQTEDWLDKALLIAHKEGAPNKYQGCKVDICYASATASWTYNILYPQFDTAYGASRAYGGNAARNQQVIDSINAGRRVVNYRGHGGEGCWGSIPGGWNIWGDNFCINNLSSLTNTSTPTLVLSIACETGNIQASPQCLGEAFTRPGVGASAFLGATCPSFTDANHIYDKKLFSAVFDEGINCVGDAINLAATKIVNECDIEGLANARMYLLLGDPSLPVVIDPKPGLFTSPGIIYPVNWYPRSLCASDIDKDGYSDIITADFYYNSLSILENQGDGTFINTGSITDNCLNGPYAVAAFDLDNDLDEDLVVANYNSSTIDIFWNDNGSFYHRPNDDSYSVSSKPVAICGASFKGGGCRFDLAVACEQGTGVAILLYNDDLNKTFTLDGYYSAGTNPSSICAADMDYDGDADLAIANSGSNNVTILKGRDGVPGKFDFAFNYATGDNPTSIATMDIDNELGDLPYELITTNMGYPMIPDGSLTTAYFEKNNNILSLKSSVTSSFQYDPYGISANDFDRDGDNDIAVIDQKDYYRPEGSTHRYSNVYILLNDEGIFNDTLVYPLYSYLYNNNNNLIPYLPISHSIISGDFDAKRSPDLAIAIEDFSDG